ADAVYFDRRLVAILDGVVHDDAASSGKSVEGVARVGGAMHRGSLREMEQVLDAVRRFDDDRVGAGVRVVDVAFKGECASDAGNRWRLLAGGGERSECEHEEQQHDDASRTLAVGKGGATGICASDRMSQAGGCVE